VLAYLIINLAKKRKKKEDTEVRMVWVVCNRNPINLAQIQGGIYWLNPNQNGLNMNGSQDSEVSHSSLFLFMFLPPTKREAKIIH
jgi:hypothetical protein